ncbi:hypothetical protein [Candidatus Leptofilum sp.]|uniref:hypothetical protein n=1 Tax=Candidatus Leptofilum sp. TaxID=3241576 RepID=UPI003B5C3CEB
MQAFFALLGSNDQRFEQFLADPVTVIRNSDLSNEDKFFLLTLGPANSNNRIAYSFNFPPDKLTPGYNENGEQVFHISGNQFNIQKGDRVLLPHVIEGSINLSTFEMNLDVKHGVIEKSDEPESDAVDIQPDTSVVHTFSFNKNNIRLLNGDFVVVGTQNNIDVRREAVDQVTQADERGEVPFHHINGVFDEKKRQLSINVFLDNPEA